MSTASVGAPVARSVARTIPLRAAPAAVDAPCGTPRAHPGARASQRARLAWLLAAPHRLFFFAGTSMLVLLSLWWLGALVARAAGAGLPWAVSPSAMHGLLMAIGFMPLYVFGFLFTAGPKWLGVEPPPIGVLQGPAAVFVAGLLLAMAGAHASAFLAAAGLAAVAAAWTVLGLRFARLIGKSPVPDTLHARVVMLGVAAGALAAAFGAVGVAGASDGWLDAGIRLAIWGFALTVYVGVLHRMLPFFTMSALPHRDPWRPAWLLVPILGAVWGHALLEWLVAVLPGDVMGAGLPTDMARGSVAVADRVASLLRGALALLDTAAAAGFLWLAFRWGLAESMRVRLLAMLHVAFAWLGLSFALYAFSGWAAILTDGTLSLGLAPLHALTIGFLSGTLLAMVTRVSRGHGGRSLEAEGMVWVAFWVLQAVVVARVVAALPLPQAGAWALLAAAGWVAVFGSWAARHAVWYLRPRADGKPG